MADEVLESCLNNFRDYNMKSYLTMRETLALISTQLNSNEQTTTLWSMENIGKALWTAAILSVYETKEPPNETIVITGTKRSRGSKSEDSEVKKNEEAKESVESLEESQEDVNSSSRKELKRSLSGRIRKGGDNK